MDSRVKAFVKLVDDFSAKNRIPFIFVCADVSEDHSRCTTPMLSRSCCDITNIAMLKAVLHAASENLGGDNIKEHQGDAPASSRRH